LSKIALQIYVNGEIISGAVRFMIRLEISSYPQNQGQVRT